MSLAVIVLAAGRGTRMRAPRPKVLHPLAGEPLVAHVLETCLPLAPARVLVVVGHRAREVREALRRYPVEFVLQEEQRGTGDAVRRCEGFLGDAAEILVLCGDAPLIETRTLEKLLARHHREQAAVTLLTAELPDPAGYGRIVRGEGGLVQRIVEERDASPKEAAIREVNSGTYVFERRFLLEALRALRPDNAQGELYLTDAVEIAFRRGLTVAAQRAEDPDEVLGVNSQRELARAEEILQRRLREKWMEAGVSFLLPETVYLEKRVRLAPGVRLHPHVVLRGETQVGEGAEVLSFCYLEDVVVAPWRRVGPGARLRGVHLPPEQETTS